MSIMEKIYKNPPHPLDLTLTELNEIRLKFEEAKQLALQNNVDDDGITLEQLSQILSQKINQEPSKLQKYLSRTTQFKKINWNQFLQLLDIESDLRDQLLDWNMFDIKTKKLVKYQRKELKPLNRQTDRIYYILKMLYFSQLNKNFMVIVFDDSTISIFDTCNYEIIIEFKISYEFTMEKFLEQEKTKLLKIQQRNQIYEMKEKQEKEQKKERFILTQQRERSKESRRRQNFSQQRSREINNFTGFLDNSQGLYDSMDEDKQSKSNNIRQKDLSFKSGKSRESELNNNFSKINNSLDQSPNFQSFNISLMDDKIDERDTTIAHRSSADKQQQVKRKCYRLFLRMLEERYPNMLPGSLQLVYWNIAIFIRKLKEAVKLKRHQIKYEEQKKQFIQMNAQKDYDEYLGKHAKQINKMFQVFRMLPQKESTEFSSKMGQVIQNRKIQSISIDYLANLQKNQRLKQKKKAESLLDEQGPDLEISNQIYKRHEQEQKIQLLRRDLQVMTKAVDIDPRTLRPRSKDPKDKDSFTTPSKYNLQAFQQQYLDSKKSKKSQDANMKKLKKRNMFVTAMAYCQENGLLFVGLINQEIHIFKFGLNEKNSSFYLNKLFVFKCADVPQEIKLTKHRIKGIQICIILQQNNQIRIHQYDYQSKTQTFTFDTTPQYHTQIQFEVATLLFEQSLGFTVSSFQGDFALYMDHNIKVPQSFGNQKTNPMSNISRFKVPEHDKLFYNVLRRKIDCKDGAISITCAAYDQKQKIIVFGSLNGKVTFFNAMCNEVCAISQNTQSQIMEIFCYDQQNQVITISKDYTISVWDIMRYQLIQSLKTIRDISLDFQYEMHTFLFLPQQGVLYIAGNVLQSWISVVDKQREFNKMQMQSIYFWRQKSSSKQAVQQLKINSGNELNKILSNNENKVTLPANIFVKRKQPLPTTRILWVIQANDQILTFESTKHLKVYQLPTLRLTYSFLFGIPEEIDQILSFSATEDLKIIGIATLKQEVRLFNLYTQELLQTIEFQNHIVYLGFMQPESEYFFVIGHDDGEIIFCSSTLKGKKKLKNKNFQSHRRPIIQMEKNSQYLVSISEDLMICLWSLNSCSLKKQLSLPQPLNSLKNTDDLFQQYMPAFVQFTENNTFFILTNSGDLHEYNATEATQVASYTCSIPLYNGYGQILFKSNEIIAVDQSGTIRIFQKTQERKQLSNMNSSTRLNVIPNSPLRKRRRGGQQDKNEEVIWINTFESTIYQESYSQDMMPTKIIAFNNQYFVFCGFSYVIIFNQNLDKQSLTYYENNASKYLSEQIQQL